MRRIVYIFPPLVTGAMVLLFANYDYWWAYLLMVALSELILWAIIRRGSYTREYLSGYALNVQHHEPWVERVERIETYTDSKGNVHQRRVVDYVHHPDRWLMPLNTGRYVDVHPDVYNEFRLLWATPEVLINPPHINCVGGGGGQLYEWNNNYSDAATHTYTGHYINYLANSRSIFRKEKVSPQDAETYGLIDYPKYSSRHLEHPVVLGSLKLPEWVEIAPEVQREFCLINAFAGHDREIHIFILLFDAAQGIATALKQQAYWNGGNKNEFVVCLGVDFAGCKPSDVPTDTPTDTPTDSPSGVNVCATVKWSKAFSWCDAPRLEAATESYFIAHKELDLRGYAEWLRNNLELWKRKEFSDFKYLGVNLSPRRKVALAVMTVILCVAIVVISCAVALDVRKRDRYHYGDYSGYGYELLDNYILPSEES